MDKFRDDIAELAFGDNAGSRGFTDKEIVLKIRQYMQELDTFLTYQKKEVYDDDADPMDVSEEDFEYIERLEDAITKFHERSI